MPSLRTTSPRGTFVRPTGRRVVTTDIHGLPRPMDAEYMKAAQKTPKHIVDLAYRISQTMERSEMNRILESQAGWNNGVALLMKTTRESMEDIEQVLDYLALLRRM